MTKNLVEIASEIVQTQVSRNPMSALEISSSLRQVFGALHELYIAESREIEPSEIEAPHPAPPLKPEHSIQDDKIICLECGVGLRQLTKLHLDSHSLSAKEYKKKYGFTAGTPLTAKSLTRARQKAAKKRGLPENLVKSVEARRQAKRESQKLVSPQSSIQEDKVICLECGAQFRQLTEKHLVSHGLSSDEYRSKYGFSKATPLAAKSLIATRQANAQKTGLSERMKQFWEAKRLVKATSGTDNGEAGAAGSERAKRVQSLFSPKQTG
ncbi:MAG: MucR family transcriptional regulator [Syntrophobacteraceae bacterium]|nr:MucR family transcriptional regulator [Syntrophobacteraceae bacterium]